MGPSRFDLSSTYPVTSAQVDTYHRDGHILLRNLASHEEVAHFRPLIVDLVDEIARTRDLWVRLDDSRKLFRQVINVWRMSEAIKELIFAKRFARVAAQLMGVKGVRLYHDRALIKDPGGTATPWHKDHYSWPLATHNTTKFWLALSDISLDMGAMVFASGTHRGAHFPELPISLGSEEMLARMLDTYKVPTMSYIMRAGDVTFHSGDVLHSALENTSPHRRELVAIMYYADGTLVLEPNNEHRKADLKEFLPGLKPGDIAATEMNPLLFESP